MKYYPNIRYIVLEQDPGIYGVWNIGIQHAQAPFITNANLDDRRNPECLEIQAHTLEQNPDIDLVYSDYCITCVPNQLLIENNKQYRVRPPEFGPKNMYLCLPGPQPMWRKSMHKEYGYFNESFLYSGDMEMWLRAVSQGALFRKISLISGLYYYNPQGLSTDPNPTKAARRTQENAFICQNYSHVWQ